MAFKYTALRDVPDERDHLAAPPAIVLPSHVDLSEWEPPVTDQGDEGCCTAQTGVRILSWMYKRFKGESLVFSPQFLYRAERICEGDVNQDGGAQSRTMMAVLREVGCCMEKTFPYSDKGWTTPTTEDMLAEAHQYKTGAYHRIPDLDTLRSVLASGYPASVAISVFESFESEGVAATGHVPVPDPAREKNLGGHEVFVYGYDDAAHVLLLTNSWGTSWGDRGHFTLPYAYWPFVWDSWTCHLGQAWK
jgi:C1A family cysteine protease